jgi:hypothetical protein
MLIQAFLRRLVVVRRDRQQAGDTQALHLARNVDNFLRVVPAGAGKNGHLAMRFVDQYLDDPQPLFGRQRRSLARRAAWHEEMDAAVDLTPAQPSNRRFVEIAVLRKRRDQGCPNASE